jgi:uncharacterized protein YqjF (DUF2071 family)
MSDEPEPVTAGPPPTRGPTPLGVALSDVAFVHWPYDPAEVRPLLPHGMRPDTVDGAAYVGLVGFRMRCYGEFLELNVRTYSVDRRGRRGVVFLSMESDRLPWVLAGRAGRLPYHWSRMSLSRAAHRLEYRSVRRSRSRSRERPSSQIRLRIGEPIEGGRLDHFLTARWRVHHRVLGATVAGRLTHDRWPLHAAELEDLQDELIAASGIRPPTEPPASVLYAPAVRGRLGLPRPV